MAVEKVKKSSVKKSTKLDFPKRVEKRIALLKLYDAKEHEEHPDLLGDDEKRSVFLQFQFTRSKAKPDVVATPIKVPNYVYDPKTTEVCLFVRKPQRTWKDKYETEREDFPAIQRIIDLEHFVKKYPTPKDKRSFVQSYHLFYCDDRIAHKVPSLLGLEFKRCRKVPRGLRLRSDKTLKDVVLPAMSETSLLMKCGSTTSIRIGDASFGAKHLAENAVAVIKYMEGLMDKLNGEGDAVTTQGGNKRGPNVPWRIMSVAVQLTNSISVPLVEKETEIADEVVAIAKKELLVQAKEDTHS